MPSTRILRLSVALLGYVAPIVFGACSTSVDSTKGSAWGLNPCANDDDCSSELGCNVASRRCIPRAAFAVGLELTPSIRDSDAWVRQEYLEAEPSAEPAALNIDLEPAVALRGVVVGSSDPAVDLSAQVIVSRASSLSGRPAVQFETSTGPQADDQSEEGFTIWVNDHQTYRVDVVPRAPHDGTAGCVQEASGCSTAFPPLFGQPLDIDGALDTQLVLDGKDHTVLITGSVLDAVGQPLAFPVELRANVVGTESSSTVARTCSEGSPEYCSCSSPQDCPGSFAMRLVPTERALTVRIASVAQGSTFTDTTAEDLPPIPTVTCNIDPLPLDTVHDVPSYDLPSPLYLPSFRLAAPYEVTVLGESGDPVAGAQVTFKTEDIPPSTLTSSWSSCTAIYTRSATTDADGRAQLLLLPGDAENRRYEVRVNGPARSPHASIRLEGLEVGPQPGTLAPLHLARRDRIVGRLVGPTGAAVAGALIDAQPAPDQADDRAIAASSALTDTTGRFLLYLDRGIYELTVSPETSTGLPVFHVHNFVMDASRDDVQFTVPEPTVLTGTLRGPDGEPAIYATVQAYATSTADADALGSIAPTGPQLLASGLTDERGHFSMVLPKP